MTDPQVCVVTHRRDPDRPRLAVDGGYVCRGCEARLAQLIAELPAQFSELTRALGTSREVGSPKVSGSPSAGLPFRPRVADHLPDITGKLLSWCRLVVEERPDDLTLPDFHPRTVPHDPARCGYVRPPHTYTRPGDEPEEAVWNDAWLTCPRCGWEARPLPSVNVMAAWLGLYLPWIVAQPWVDEFKTEVEDLSAEAWRLLDVNPDRRRFPIPGERCPECGEDLYVVQEPEPAAAGATPAHTSATVPAAEAPPEPKVVTVVRCGGEHEWTEQQFRRLGHRLLKAVPAAGDSERMGA